MLPHPRRLLLALLLVSGASGLATAHDQAGAPRYRIEDVGAFSDVTVVTALNDDGVVAGYGYRHVPPGHLNSLLSTPFYWKSGKARSLPTLGGTYGKALGINSRGDIAGFAEDKRGSDFPVIWRKQRNYAVEQLDKREGEAVLIQNDGTVLGLVRDEETQSFVSWKDGRCRDLLKSIPSDAIVVGVDAQGTLYGSVPSAPNGTSFSPHRGYSRACRWKDGRSDLLPSRDRLGDCRAVNAKGLAVGWLENPWNGVSWRDGKLDLLPTPNGYGSRAAAVNDRGDIVGECFYFPREGENHSFAALWRDGRVHDLNSLVRDGSKWKLQSPTAISTRGLIAGTGRLTEERGESQRAFLLRPEPSSK